jgi:hypothetical protein
MNHYCTYFDRGFLIQGLALWRSLAARDPDSVLWVLALDDFTAQTLRQTGGTWMRIVALTELEAGDPELAAAKANRSRVEYYFTLSPCWPRWLLAAHPEITRVTYVDADMLFFANPEPVFDAMDAAGASVLVTAHRFPEWLQHYERHGKFNVGLLSFRNDAAGRDCLADWRARCLEWCHDRLENGRYADQKYLDAWPVKLGAALLVLDHAGVNLAPWNWMSQPCEVDRGTVRVADRPLVVFHFARFRPLGGTGWWQSGQLDYGVMPWRLRQALYGGYWQALAAARAELSTVHPGFDFPQQGARFGRAFWRGLILRVVFGSDWLRAGDIFISGRLGLGRYSGRGLSLLRKIFSRSGSDASA